MDIRSLEGRNNRLFPSFGLAMFLDFLLDGGQ
jgi:hypothetical protein